MPGVVVNEAALDLLLESPVGPVGQMLVRVSEQVAGNYEAVIGVVWENQDASLQPRVDYDVAVGDEGLRSIVGIPFEGRISDYMARKMEVEQDQKVGAIMQAWDNPI